MTTRIRLSFSYPEEIKQALEKIATQELRSLPNLIKFILDKHLTKIQKENV